MCSRQKKEVIFHLTKVLGEAVSRSALAVLMGLLSKNGHQK